MCVMPDAGERDNLKYPRALDHDSGPGDVYTAPGHTTLLARTDLSCHWFTRLRNATSLVQHQAIFHYRDHVSS